MIFYLLNMHDLYHMQEKRIFNNQFTKSLMLMLCKNIETWQMDDNHSVIWLWKLPIYADILSFLSAVQLLIIHTCTYNTDMLVWKWKMGKLWSNFCIFTFKLIYINLFGFEILEFKFERMFFGTGWKILFYII